MAWLLLRVRLNAELVLPVVLAISYLAGYMVLPRSWAPLKPEQPWHWLPYLGLVAATIGLSGVLFILLGIIAEVQARIYFEARGKPPYKVASVVQYSKVVRPIALARRW